MPKQRSKQTIRGLPRTNSNAPSPRPWSVVWTKQRRRKGPEPGTLDRFGKADRALYGDLKRLMSETNIQVSGCWSIPAQYASFRRVPIEIHAVSQRPKLP